MILRNQARAGRRPVRAWFKYAIQQFSPVLGRSVELLQCTRREHVLTLPIIDQLLCCLLYLVFLNNYWSPNYNTAFFLIASAINQQAEVRLVALDIEGAFGHVGWDGVLEHFRSIGCRGRMYRLFQSYFSDRYIRVVASFDSSDLYCISMGIPQGAIWLPLLLNLCIRLLPSVVKHSLVVGYADDHTHLMTIPEKTDRAIAADHLIFDLTALYKYGQPWNIIFAPSDIFISYFSEVWNIRTPSSISK